MLIALVLMAGAILLLTLMSQRGRSRGINHPTGSSGNDSGFFFGDGSGGNGGAGDCGGGSDGGGCGGGGD